MLPELWNAGMRGICKLMSYDLRLFSIPQGVEPQAAYEQLIHREESEIVDIGERVKQPLPDSTRATMQQLVDTVRSRWPAFVQFQPASPLVWIELNDDDLQIQFVAYEQTASITVPYFREGTAQLKECLKSCLQACREKRGYVAYDPQLGRIVTVSDLDQIADAYRGVDNALPGIRRHASKAKPWWKFW
jgi:hypothetical protein